MAIHYVALLSRRNGLSLDEFLKAWLGEHAELAAALPLVREVRFMPAISKDAFAGDCDGAGILVYDSIDALETSLKSDQARLLRAHTATFADAASVVRVVVESTSGGWPE